MQFVISFLVEHQLEVDVRAFILFLYRDFYK